MSTTNFVSGNQSNTINNNYGPVIYHSPVIYYSPIVYYGPAIYYDLVTMVCFTPVTFVERQPRNLPHVDIFERILQKVMCQKCFLRVTNIMQSFIHHIVHDGGD
jgi:hypothetical protein